MGDLPEALERLTARLEILERRVCALEHVSEAPALLPVPQATPLQAAPAAELPSSAQAASMFSVLGKAMLGIAGAYVLRAVAESGSLPKLAVAAVAIVYAIFWLVWSARVKAGQWLVSTVYACTSALILGPMLWELTLSFKVLPPPMTAAILCLFVIAAAAIAWKHDLVPVIWVANVSAALVALGLSFAAHDLPPFIGTLLLMVLICEVAAARNRELSVRPLVAAAADLAIWALIFIYSSAPNTRTEYKSLGVAQLLIPASLLFLIYAAGVTLKTVVQKRNITIFETGQTLVAFLLLACSLLYFLQVTGSTVLGAICIALSAASYVAVFLFLQGETAPRNLRVFATWSAALFLAGSWLLVPPSWLAAWLCIASLAAAVLGARPGRVELQIHGLVYLVAASVSSGMPFFVFSALAGVLPATPAWSVFVVAACSAVCYAIARPPSAHQHGPRILRLLPAVVAVCAVAALLVQGLFALGIATGAYHIAFLRSIVTCALALALAFSGSRWRRVELNWIAYTTLVFVAAKLLFEDLRHGHLAFIAASIFVFAVTLIAVPRLARMGQRDLGPASTAPSHQSANRAMQ